MTKLTDTQMILLSQASQREDHSLLPVPASIRTPAHIVTRLLGDLMTSGLAIEQPNCDPAQRWREDGDGRYGLYLTDAGLTAIVGADDAPPEQGKRAAPKASKSDEPPAVATVSPRKASKTDQLIGLLQRPDGASIDDMVTALGWLPHTARAALTGLKKKGHQIVRDKVGSVTVYKVSA